MSRIFNALVRSGVDENLALRIDHGYNAAKEPPGAYLARLGEDVLEAAAEFGAGTYARRDDVESEARQVYAS